MEEDDEGEDLDIRAHTRISNTAVLINKTSVESVREISIANDVVLSPSSPSSSSLSSSNISSSSASSLSSDSSNSNKLHSTILPEGECCSYTLGGEGFFTFLLLFYFYLNESEGFYLDV